MNGTLKNKKKILAISKKLGLAHIGSCLSVLPILEEIYQKKQIGDKVIMDNAHAHLAHLVVQFGHLNSHIEEASILNYGIHCDRRAGCDANGGSLGHGTGIGIGMALAHRNKMIYVIVSDGSMQEGSNWEALRISNDLGLVNLHIYCNFNGYTAVAKSKPYDLELKMNHFNSYVYVRNTNNGKGFKGVQGHYKKL